MKIDQYNKTITVEYAIDFVPATNYLTKYLTPEEAKEWKIKSLAKPCLKTTK